MDPGNRILFENEKYKLYSSYESVYLKNKNTNSPDEDLFITYIYGDPDSALISFNNEFIAIAGCGISIYFLSSSIFYELGTEAENTLWTEGIYQSADDDQYCIRFSAYTSENLLRIHRLDVKKQEVTVL